MDKIKEKFKKLPSKMFKTITFDQGVEFADHRHLEKEIKCKVYLGKKLAAKMNRCPRKCLGYKTPQEVFIQQYKNDCRIWS